MEFSLPRIAAPHLRAAIVSILFVGNTYQAARQCTESDSSIACAQIYRVEISFRSRGRKICMPLWRAINLREIKLVSRGSIIAICCALKVLTRMYFNFIVCITSILLTKGKNIRKIIILISKHFIHQLLIKNSFLFKNNLFKYNYNLIKLIIDSKITMCMKMDNKIFSYFQVA